MASAAPSSNAAPGGGGSDKYTVDDLLARVDLCPREEVGPLPSDAERYKPDKLRDSLAAVRAIDEPARYVAHELGPKLLKKWLKDRRVAIKAVLDLCKTARRATAFNDLYKWTMWPVMRNLEERFRVSEKPTAIKVTFGMDIRDPSLRELLNTANDNADGKKLRDLITAKLKIVCDREFDPRVFDAMYADSRDALAVSKEEAKTMLTGKLAIFVGEFFEVDTTKQLFETNAHYASAQAIADAGGVAVLFYRNNEAVYNDAEAGHGVVFVEAVGPWSKVTWLETSMMQAVYEAKTEYDNSTPDLASQWMANALLRCAKSVAFTRHCQNEQKRKISEQTAAGVPVTETPFPSPALFADRRTGNYEYIMLMNLFFGDHFNPAGPLYKPAGSSYDEAVKPSTYTDGMQDKTVCIGTSACDVWFDLTRLGLPCPNPMGTHAHELSMVSSVLFPEADMRLPGVSQVITHKLYYDLVFAKCGSQGPSPMLPDTLGTRTFLLAAKKVRLDDGRNFLDLINSARQDSGNLHDFATLLVPFGYNRGKMASEIDDTATYVLAHVLKYSPIGAGGFYGDSQKVWGGGAASKNSMAVKPVKVVYFRGGGLLPDAPPILEEVQIEGGIIKVTGDPIKIGDPESLAPADLKIKEGKLSLSRNNTAARVESIKRYAEAIRRAAMGIEASTISLNDFFPGLGLIGGGGGGGSSAVVTAPAAAAAASVVVTTALGGNRRNRTRSRARRQTQKKQKQNQNQKQQRKQRQSRRQQQKQTRSRRQ